MQLQISGTSLGTFTQIFMTMAITWNHVANQQNDSVAICNPGALSCPITIL